MSSRENEATKGNGLLEQLHVPDQHLVCILAMYMCRKSPDAFATLSTNSPSNALRVPVTS